MRRKMRRVLAILTAAAIFSSQGAVGTYAESGTENAEVMAASAEGSEEVETPTAETPTEAPTDPPTEAPTEPPTDPPTETPETQPATEAPAEVPAETQPATEMPAQTAPAETQPATEAVSDVIENSDKTQTNASETEDPFKETEEEETEEDVTDTFSAKVGKATITVELAEADMLPESAKLTVKEITKSSDAEKAQKYENKLRTVTDEGHRELSDAVYYKVSLKLDGEAVELEKKAVITVSYDNAYDLGLREALEPEAEVYQLGDETKKLSDVGLDQDSNVKEFEVKCDSFSVLALAGVQDHVNDGEKITLSELSKLAAGFEQYALVTGTYTVAGEKTEEIPENILLAKEPKSDESGEEKSETEAETKAETKAGADAETEAETEPETVKETVSEETAKVSGKSYSDAAALLGKLEEKSLVLANGVSTSEVSVINLYADENGNIGQSALKDVYNSSETAIDVTDHPVVVNIVAASADQKLDIADFDVENRYTGSLGEADQKFLRSGRILYNVVAQGDKAGEVKLFRGTIVASDSVLGSWIAPAATVVLEGNLTGAAYAAACDTGKDVKLTAAVLLNNPAKDSADNSAKDPENGSVKEDVQEVAVTETVQEQVANAAEEPEGNKNGIGPIELKLQTKAVKVTDEESIDLTSDEAKSIRLLLQDKAGKGFVKVIPVGETVIEIDPNDYPDYFPNGINSFTGITLLVSDLGASADYEFNKIVAPAPAEGADPGIAELKVTLKIDNTDTANPKFSLVADPAAVTFGYKARSEEEKTDAQVELELSSKTKTSSYCQKNCAYTVSVKDGDEVLLALAENVVSGADVTKIRLKQTDVDALTKLLEAKKGTGTGETQAPSLTVLVKETRVSPLLNEPAVSEYPFTVTVTEEENPETKEKTKKLVFAAPENAGTNAEVRTEPKTDESPELTALSAVFMHDAKTVSFTVRTVDSSNSAAFLGNVGITILRSMNGSADILTPVEPGTQTLRPADYPNTFVVTDNNGAMTMEPVTVTLVDRNTSPVYVLDTGKAVGEEIIEKKKEVNISLKQDTTDASGTLYKLEADKSLVTFGYRKRVETPVQIVISSKTSTTLDSNVYQKNCEYTIDFQADTVDEEVKLPAALTGQKTVSTSEALTLSLPTATVNALYEALLTMKTKGLTPGVKVIVKETKQNAMIGAPVYSEYVFTVTLDDDEKMNFTAPVIAKTEDQKYATITSATAETPLKLNTVFVHDAKAISLTINAMESADTPTQYLSGASLQVQLRSESSSGYKTLKTITTAGKGVSLTIRPADLPSTFSEEALTGTSGVVLTVVNIGAPNGYKLDAGKKVVVSNIEETVLQERDVKLCLAADGTLKMEPQIVTFAYKREGADATATNERIVAVKRVFAGTTDIYPTSDKKFYAALFQEINGKMERVSDTETITVKSGSTSGSFTFENLNVGTYYLYETTSGGELLNGSSTLTISYASDEEAVPNRVNVTGVTAASHTITIKNAYKSLPSGYRYYKKIKVTKVLQNKDGSEKQSSDKFYFGVYRDGKKVGNTQELALKGKSSVSKTIGLPMTKDSHTYEVKELNADGTVMESGKTYDISITNAAGTLRREDDTIPSVVITNKLLKTDDETEDESKLQAKLTLTKKVTYKGKPIRVNSVYYIGIFDDANLTKLRMKKALQFKNASEVSSSELTINLYKLKSKSVTFYIAEVDKDGNVVESGKKSGYDISPLKQSVTLDKDHLKEEAVITNDIREGSRKEQALTDPTSGFGGDSAAVAEAQEIANSEKDPAKANTGDNAPILPLMIALVAALVVILGLIFKRSRKKR